MESAYNTYYDERAGALRRIRRGIPEARREIDRYNAVKNEVERLEARLRSLYEKQRVLGARAFAALPEGHGILMGEVWELGSSETGEEVAR